MPLLYLATSNPTSSRLHFLPIKVDWESQPEGTSHLCQSPWAEGPQSQGCPCLQSLSRGREPPLRPYCHPKACQSTQGNQTQTNAPQQPSASQNAQSQIQASQKSQHKTGSSQEDHQNTQHGLNLLPFVLMSPQLPVNWQLLKIWGLKDGFNSWKL